MHESTRNSADFPVGGRRNHAMQVKKESFRSKFETLELRADPAGPKMQVLNYLANEL